MMKKLFLMLCLLLFPVSQTAAVNLVQKEDVLKRSLIFAGLTDFPPFSFYEEYRADYIMTSAFLNPMKEVFKKYSFTFKKHKFTQEQFQSLPLLLLAVRSGDVNVFIGAMSDTKLFSGLELIYPAIISNPIHIITTPEGLENIKSMADLTNLKGVICKQEYFSDFILRKIKPLNIEYVDTPYDAYEKIFTEQADYILGSSYYNRIMSSRYGLNRYLAYSKNPVFKIPMFVALSKVTPVLDEYVKVFSAEFSKPAFAAAVKREIIRIIDEEEAKNDGIVPPSFARDLIQQQAERAAEEDENTEEKKEDTSGRIVEKKVVEKTIDEVLEGI